MERQRPVRRLTSSPFSWASRRAFGEIRALPRGGALTVGATAGDDASVRGDAAAAGDVATGKDSPGLTSHAIV
jgi:hypothetical protein